MKTVGAADEQRQQNGGKTTNDSSGTISSGKARKPGPNRAGCFACSEKGHFSRDCKQKCQTTARHTEGKQSEADDTQQTQKQSLQGSGPMPRGGGKSPAPTKTVFAASRWRGAPSSGDMMPPERIVSTGGVQQPMQAEASQIGNLSQCRRGGRSNVVRCQVPNLRVCK